MKLAVLGRTYAVCRFRADATPPLWVFGVGGGGGADAGASTSTTAATGNASSVDQRQLQHHEFEYSITKTSDELSIVCPDDVVPSAPAVAEVATGTTASSSSSSGPKIETGWRCLKVLGPLDFGMTGVLSSLAAPLAAAEIPIFVLSTYDTDYLLVKNNKLRDAVQVLRDGEGHDVVGFEDESQELKRNSDGSKTADGPAITFEPDPLVSMLVSGPDEAKKKGQCFGLVVVAGWPPNLQQLGVPYGKFLQAVRECWDESDVAAAAEAAGPPPPLYFYPPTALHVTAATMVRPQLKHLIEPVVRRRLVVAWTDVMKAATQSPAWPTQPLELVIESSQIGSKAGILIWKETTGGMESIRNCLQVAFEELKRPVFEKLGLFVQDEVSVKLSVPNIIHSTFLRYYSTPSSPGELVQRRFKERVLPNLSNFFPDPIRVPVAKLVCERNPYMHIPHTSETVFATSFLLTSTSGEVDDGSRKFVSDSTTAEDQLNKIYDDMNSEIK